MSHSPCARLALFVSSAPENANTAVLPRTLAEHAETCPICQEELARASHLLTSLEALEATFTPAPNAAARAIARHRAAHAAPARPRRARGPLVFALGTLAGAGLVAAVVLATTGGGSSDGPGDALGPGDPAIADHGDPTATPDDAPAPDGLRVAACLDAAAEGCAGDTTVEAPLGAIRAFTLSDGSTLRLNQRSLARLDADGRGLTLERGEAWLHVASDPARPPFTVSLPTGRVTVLGTTFQVRAGEALSVVDVLEGRVRVASGDDEATVHAGQEAILARGAAPRVFTAGDLDAAAWADPDASDGPEADGDDAAHANLGFGTLRARRPGAKADADLALRLVDHRVDVRVQGIMARTEIEESFANDTAHTLEGVYTFTLPAGAQVARLDLLVEDTWEEGSMVDRERAEKIWRGVIRNATPKAQQRSQVEYIWVPGPWHDPALLSWKQGNTFELRIFPIPGHGERRVRIAYTETLPAVPGARRYTYPLPPAVDGGPRAERFALRMQVGGQHAPDDVRVANYALEGEVTEAGVTLSTERARFVPDGDLIVDVPDPSAGVELRSWAFADPNAPDEAGYALLALRPEVRHVVDRDPLDVVFVVDTSYSVQAARLGRAAELVGEITRGLGETSRVTTLACATRCVPVGPRLAPASATLADELVDRLSRREPLGTTRLAHALAEARRVAHAAGARPDRLRIIYLGDGVTTVGELDTARLQAAARDALGEARLTTVGLGGEVDTAALTRLARAGGGAHVDLAALGGVRRAANRVLARQWGEPVRGVEVVLPDGLAQVAPELPTELWPGEEHLVSARLASTVAGEVILRGELGGAPWERSYDLSLAASTSLGNAFIPRLWAEHRIAALEETEGEAARDAIVALSIAHHVLSQHTSLLVLESPAMAKAFDVEATRPALEWTGDEEDVATAGAVAGTSASADDDASFAAGKAESRPRSSTSGRVDFFTEDGGGGSGAAFNPTRTRRRRMVRVAVKKVWYREASVGSAQPTNAWETRQLALREQAWDENRDSRDRTAKLLRWHLRLGDVDAAERLATRWLEKDRMDPEALIALADIAALRGDLERSAELLASAVEVDFRNTDAHARMIALYSVASDDELRCEHALTRALLAPTERDAQVAAMRCGGDGARHLARLEGRERRLAERALATDEVPRRVTGPVRVTARWEGAAPLSVVIVGPGGQRLSWQGGAPGLLASRGPGTEALAFRPPEVGRHQLRIVRDVSGDAAITDALPAVDGTVTVTAYGTTRRLRFELGQGETEATVADVNVQSRWRHEPISGRPRGPGLESPTMPDRPSPFR